MTKTTRKHRWKQTTKGFSCERKGCGIKSRLRRRSAKREDLRRAGRDIDEMVYYDKDGELGVNKTPPCRGP